MSFIGQLFGIAVHVVSLFIELLISVFTFFIVALRGILAFLGI